MPIYEYECTKCGNKEEAIQSFSDKPLTKCSKCSGKLHKLISQSTFHLKGSGWYVTDYANKSTSSNSSGTSASAVKTTTDTKKQPKEKADKSL
ncbi:MAG: zinc ribbon domain-containing protein [Desulfobacterales bacterium]|nr:zinc ribbon domain-containing protein [Desulfobacterales bacterium]